MRPRRTSLVIGAVVLLVVFAGGAWAMRAHHDAAHVITEAQFATVDALMRSGNADIDAVTELLGPPARVQRGLEIGGWSDRPRRTETCSFWYIIGEPEGGEPSWDSVPVCFTGGDGSIGRGSDMDPSEFREQRAFDAKHRGATIAVTHEPSESPLQAF